MTATGVRNTALPVEMGKRNWLVVSLSSVTLGAAAFLGDAVPGMLGTAMLVVTSSGLAWGLAALLFGFRQQTLRRAVVTSTVLLLGATAIYYLLILGVSQRWRGGGGSANSLGLYSVGLSATFWAVASLCAGPILGFVAWRMKVGSSRESAILAGVVFGLFSAQGLHTLFFQNAWLILDDFGIRLLVSAILTIALSGLATGHLVRRMNLVAASRLVMLSAGVSAALGLALWRLAEVARMLAGV